jgi:geranylgeranyl diphosphate synthase type II
MLLKSPQIWTTQIMNEIAYYQDIFLKHLAENKITGEPSSLYEPANYILQLGGKRMRPVLLLMAYHAFDEELNNALDAAMAVEVFHNFTLAHDDIMDAAPLRRGQSTLHEKYNLPVAILAGDVLLIKSYQLLLKNPGKADPLQLLTIFNKAAIEICEGQQMDMDFESSDEVSEEAYLKMIAFKTAVLLGAVMEIGALMGGASARDAGLMYQFALNVGLAFQVRDDFLDTFGDPEKVGKMPGGDIIQNKKTLLMIRCLAHASETEKAEIFSNEGSSSEKIGRVIRLYLKYEVDSGAQQVQEYYYNQAMLSLDQVNITEARKTVLKQFARWLLERTH